MGVPQNSLVEDDPETIDNTDRKNQACQISISFKGESKNLMNNGVNYYQGNPGLGFTVNISGLGRSGIAMIAKNPLDKNGRWYLQQLTWADLETTRFGQSAPRRSLYETFIDPIDLRSIFRNDKTSAGWIDHPGPDFIFEGKRLTGHYGKWNFTIKGMNGSKHCEVDFHVITSMGNDGIFHAHWGRGLF